jgi:hypothetical protein
VSTVLVVSIGALAAVLLWEFIKAAIVSRRPSAPRPVNEKLVVKKHEAEKAKETYEQKLAEYRRKYPNSRLNAVRPDDEGDR